MVIKKNSILYFSGTGNTYEIAEKVAKTCGLELINIAALRMDSVIDIDCGVLGLACPVYYGGIPLLMSETLRKLRGGENSYLFSLATYGGMPANPFGIMDTVLQQNNMKLSNGFLLHMPGNYIVYYGARRKSVQRQNYRKANQKIRKIAGIIKEKRVERYEKSPYLIDRPFSAFSNKRVKGLALHDKKFRVDKDRCNDCRICMKICPVQNITLENGEKKWNGRCEQCMACIQYCPKEAIQYGDKTVKRKRYRNPNVDYLKVRWNESI